MLTQKLFRTVAANGRIFTSAPVVALALFSLFTFTLSALTAYAESADVFVPLPAYQIKGLSLAQAKRVENIKRRPTTASVVLMRVNALALREGGMRISLPGAKRLEFSMLGVESRNVNDFIWFGKLADAPGDATLVVHKGNITGTIREEADLYSIEPVGNGVHALIKVDESRYPPEDTPLSTDDADLKSLEAIEAKQGVSLNEIDVLVAYTQIARDRVGDIAATIQLAIWEANQSYQNSGINIKLFLVDSFELTYSEGKKSEGEILADFVGMADVNARRNHRSADVAMLIADLPETCGKSTVLAREGTAFAVVDVLCATGRYSFAHEIGHLQGARHNWAKDNSTEPFAYGHGYISPMSSWRTIMSYDCPQSSCPRVNYWSNPNIFYNGDPMGTVDREDNARVLNQTAGTVAGFRTRPVGWILRHTESPCTGTPCPGWEELDRNASTVRIVASGDYLYQLRNNGEIWRFTGIPCSGDFCSGWEKLDGNPLTNAIFADGDKLYQLWINGAIWRFTGQVCDGNFCPGWEKLDNNPATVTLAAAGGRLYQLHSSGWIWQFTGTACTGDFCPGWRLLDNNPHTVSIAAGGDRLYQLHDSGWIWQFTGTACSGSNCPGWQLLDVNPATIGIVAGNELYQLREGGEVLRFNGIPCSSSACTGWQLLADDSAINIVAAGSRLYQLNNDGLIERSTGVPCSNPRSCLGWEMMDNTPSTGRIAAGDGDDLYQLYLEGTPFTRQRSCFECRQ